MTKIAIYLGRERAARLDLEIWNQAHPVGSPVVYRRESGKRKAESENGEDAEVEEFRTTTRSQAFLVDGEQWVMLQGVPGCVALGSIAEGSVEEGVLA
jgi:hypothetical protein